MVQVAHLVSQSTNVRASFFCTVVGVLVTARWFWSKHPRRIASSKFNVLKVVEPSLIVTSKPLPAYPDYREVGVWDIQSPISAILVTDRAIVYGTRFGLVGELERSVTTTLTKLPFKERLETSKRQSTHATSLEDSVLAPESSPNPKNLWWTGNGEILSIIAFEGKYLVVDESKVCILNEEGVLPVRALQGAICISVTDKFAVLGMSEARIRVVDLAAKPWGSFFLEETLSSQGTLSYHDLLDERVCEVAAAGETAIACCGRNAFVFSLEEPSVGGTILTAAKRVTCVALSHANVAITATVDGLCQSWDISSGTPIT
jgi:hypothetical protein